MLFKSPPKNEGNGYDSRVLPPAGRNGCASVIDATKTLTDPALVGQFDQLVNMRKDTVQSQMSVAYASMFTYCAIAYLLAWTIMKTLVPKHKPITNY